MEVGVVEGVVEGLGGGIPGGLSPMEIGCLAPIWWTQSSLSSPSWLKRSESAQYGNTASKIASMVNMATIVNTMIFMDNEGGMAEQRNLDFLPHRVAYDE